MEIEKGTVEVTKGGGNGADSRLVDGSRSNNGKVGQQWCGGKGPGPAPMDSEKGDHLPFKPRWMPAAWTGRRHHLSDDEEVFGAEVYAIHQALKIFEARSESNIRYTCS